MVSKKYRSFDGDLSSKQQEECGGVVVVVKDRKAEVNGVNGCIDENKLDLGRTIDSISIVVFEYRKEYLCIKRCWYEEGRCVSVVWCFGVKKLEITSVVL